MKRAIVYYSLTGNTKSVAEKLAAELGADLFALGTVNPMPEKFSARIMYGGMQATFGLKPKITGVPENILSYDEIIAGTPVWAGKHAPALHTFFHMPGVNEKVTAVFTVCGGGENKNCIPNLKKLLPALKHTVSLVEAAHGSAEKTGAELAAFKESILNR